MNKKIQKVHTYCLSILTLFFLIISCESLKHKKNLKTAEDFYQTYADRKDLNKLMGFYSESTTYIDAVPQINIEGKENIQNQYNWTDPSYKIHPQFPKTVKINQMISNDSIVIVSGIYNPYYYNGKLINKMQFNSWLYFNKDGKIEKQVEWVQYPMDILEEIINIKKSMQIN